MNEILENCGKKFQNLTEVYEVVKTAEVVKDGKTRYRIEVIKGYKGSLEGCYDVLCWKYDEARRLISFHIPWLHEETSSVALQRAIKYLSTGEI